MTILTDSAPSVLGTNHEGTAGETLAETPAEAAEARVMVDLVNALLAEGLLDVAGGEWLSAANAAAMTADVDSVDGVPVSLQWRRWWLEQGSGDALVVGLVPGIVQPWRLCPQAGVWRTSTNAHTAGPQRLTSQSLLEVFLAHWMDDEQRGRPGVDNVRDLLKTTLWQLEQAFDEAPLAGSVRGLTGAEAMQSLERRAARRDRPFHPLAKAKQGLGQADHRRFAAEFDRPFTMRWVALDRDAVTTGGGVVPGPMHEPLAVLLDGAERRALEEEMTRLGLSPDTHLALPVHPWQREQGLPGALPESLDGRHGVALASSVGAYHATSSLRSLAPLDTRKAHLKLPMAVFSLGAARYLPAVKLINGERGQRMLEQARELDPELERCLALCDERRWWSYLPDGTGLFDDAPRHLGVMTRHYPQALMDATDACPVPMAALGVVPRRGEEHPFDDWLAERGQTASPETVLMLFEELCDGFFEVVLRLYRLGLMAEIHGQNAMVVWRSGGFEALLLRDHDSVRLHLPWLAQHGIDDPEYRIRPGYSNSLYNESPEDLLFYLQTLGIQVNLGAIIEALVAHYGLAEASLWRTLGESLGEASKRLAPNEDERRRLEQVLLKAPDWPLKCVLGPLFDQQGVPGSMPSGKARTANPFRAEALGKAPSWV